MTDTDKQKWTAGEWDVDRVPNNATFGIAAGRAYGVSAKNAHGYRVPVVVWRGIARPASEEGQANARLIAASPDMAEALKDAVSMYEHMDEAEITEVFGQRDAEFVRKARAALAKAGVE